jgi:hypothetical protein
MKTFVYRYKTSLAKPTLEMIEKFSRTWLNEGTTSEISSFYMHFLAIQYKEIKIIVYPPHFSFDDYNEAVQIFNDYVQSLNVAGIFFILSFICT